MAFCFPKDPDREGTLPNGDGARGESALHPGEVSSPGPRGSAAIPALA